jgi:hypothetical protein
VSRSSRASGIKIASVTENPHQHSDERKDHQKTAAVGDAAGYQPELHFELNKDWQNYGAREQGHRPTSFPIRRQENVGLNKGKQHGEQSKLDDVGVRGDRNGFFSR